MVKDISGDGEELLKFPVAYPIKVVGRRSESHARQHRRHRARACARSRRKPDQRAREQPAALSVDHLHHQRQSREQVVALANALQASKDVIMLI